MDIKNVIEFMVTPYHQHAVNRQISFSEKYEIASVKHKTCNKIFNHRFKGESPIYLCQLGNICVRVVMELIDLHFPNLRLYLTECVNIAWIKSVYGIESLH